MFLGYWNRPDATRDKFSGRLDADGRPRDAPTTTATSGTRRATTT